MSLSLVRHRLSYATQIWAPQTIDLITKLERSQRRATKYILKFGILTVIILGFKLCQYLDMVLFF